MKTKIKAKFIPLDQICAATLFTQEQALQRIRR
jgi:hypothetical protein